MNRMRTNKFLIVGAILICSVFLLKHTIGLHDFFEGFGLGLGIVLELYGVLTLKSDRLKFRNFKRKLFTK